MIRRRGNMCIKKNLTSVLITIVLVIGILSGAELSYAD